jgi:hypothetical protein
VNHPQYINKTVGGEITTSPHLVHLFLGKIFIYDLFKGVSSADYIASDCGIINEE